METYFNDETPKKRASGEVQTRKTPISTPKNFARFLLLSNNQSYTPSPSLSHSRVVRNPFENQLYERLHLPMISSPSLFQTISTPKKQFEWTIEDLSSFNPVNLIPHETQFKEDMDPAREAQAQAAINSFFTEQKIGESAGSRPLHSNENLNIFFKYFSS
jgi:Protein aurora borealis N-terminus